MAEKPLQNLTSIFYESKLTAKESTSFGIINF